MQDHGVGRFDLQITLILLYPLWASISVHLCILGISLGELDKDFILVILFNLNFLFEEPI